MRGRLATLRERVDHATFEDKRQAVVELVKGIQIASEEIDGKNVAFVAITYRFDQVPGVIQGRGTLVPEKTLKRSLNYSGSLEIVTMWQS